MKRYDEILANIRTVQSTGKKDWREKQAQQRLVVANNQNRNSDWYCVDLEYTQAKEKDPAYGRADLVAVTRWPDAEGRHRVALIELKVGHESYSSAFPKKEDPWLRK